MPEHPPPTDPGHPPLTTNLAFTAISLLALMKLKGIGRRTALDILDGPMLETCPQTCRETLISRMAPDRSATPLRQRPLCRLVA